MPKSVYEEGDVTVLWNQAVHTDREVTANRPDIMIKYKKEKTCTLLDVAILADRNVVQKEAEKKLKYKSLCIEIQRMWNLKCTIVPVIIGGTGIITRSLRKNLETIPGNHSIVSLQKTAILGTSHTIRKVKLEAWVVGITAGSREVPGRNACDRRHTYRIIIIIIKAVPLQAWTGPEGSTRFRLSDFKTIGTRRC